MPMLVFEGYYEEAKWLTKSLYPGHTCYQVDESSALAAKVRQLTPYFTLVVENGILIDVQPREKTPEEIEEENKPKNEIEVLKKKNADLEAALALQNESNSAFMEFVLQTLGVE